VAIQDLFDGVDERATIGAPGCAAPGDISVGAHEDRTVVADLVVIEKRLFMVLLSDGTPNLRKVRVT
jgi:hypothetical protein